MYRGAIASEKNDPQFTRTEDSPSPVTHRSKWQPTNEQSTTASVGLAIRSDQIKQARKLQIPLNSFRNAWFAVLG
jgi:hypothetical protein